MVSVPVRERFLPGLMPAQCNSSYRGQRSERGHRVDERYHPQSLSGLTPRLRFGLVSISLPA